MTFITQLTEESQKKWVKMGFTKPSVIQEKSFEPLSRGENVVGVSPTGTGKTLAYLLPLFNRIKKGEGNQLLILLPSQELAAQVASVAKEWAGLLGLQVASLIGGANVSRQIESLKKKPEILVGTPGRILELIQKKKVKMHLVQTIVLDEVDHLLQENTELNLSQKIIKSGQKTMQLVCYSATAIDRDARVLMLFSVPPLVLDVSKEDTSKGEVTHRYMQVSDRKRVMLLKQLSFVENMQGIVFFNQLAELGDVESKLLYEGVPVASLASDQSKILRKGAIDQFKEGKVTYLLTTDVGARGLDFDQLPYVIQYEPPYTKESYLHRAGRTGRMGHSGEVITFVNSSNLKDAKKVSGGKASSLKEIYLFHGKLQEEKPEREIKKEKEKPKKNQSKKKSFERKSKFD